MERRQQGKPPISRAMKAQLHRKRVAAVEKRQKKHGRQGDGRECSTDREYHDNGEKRSCIIHSRSPTQQPTYSDYDEIDFDDEDEIGEADFFDDEIGDEDDPYSIDADEVIGLLRRIEWNRKALDDAHSKLKQWFSQSTDLVETWRRFTAAGGIGADDFAQFLNDGFGHRRATRKKRHLRLIVSNKPQTLRLKPQPHSGDDAA